LKTFQVAARLQSFKAAAEELFVTPSAVSHQIRRSRNSSASPVRTRSAHAHLDRRRRPLSRAHQRYFAKLESVTEQLQVRYGRTIIRLNVPPFFANELLLPRLASFSQAREETDISHRDHVATTKTHPPEADLSIVVGAGPWEGLTVHELFAQSFIAACSPAFLLENPIDSYADLTAKLCWCTKSGAMRGNAGRRVWESNRSNPTGWSASTTCRQWCWPPSRASAWLWSHRA